MSWVPHMPCEWCARKDAEINRQSVKLVEAQDTIQELSLKLSRLESALASAGIEIGDQAECLLERPG